MRRVFSFGYRFHNRDGSFLGMGRELSAHLEKLGKVSAGGERRRRKLVNYVFVNYYHCVVEL